MEPILTQKFAKIEQQPLVSSKAEASSESLVWRVLIFELLQVVVPAVALAVVIHLFLAQATIVYGQSMEPNLHEFERLIVDKVSYRLDEPLRQDIVVLELPYMEEMLVKRVIGLPGETIEIRQGLVFVNGQQLNEPLVLNSMPHNMPTIILGKSEYFVLGDNRNNSNDSRSFGPVERAYIVGRVWLRYWPFTHLKSF